jgi:hypothetical protein
MSDLTLGQGLVVNRFRNSDNNRIFNPIGIQAQSNIRELVMIKAFLADVNDPSLGGVHVAFEPSIYHFGAGYYFDLDQYRATDRTSDIRYTRYQARTSGATIFPDTAAVRADVNIYELEFSTTVSENYSLSARIMCDFAQKLHQGKSDGFLLRAPGFFFAWPKLSAQGGLLFESGRILSYQFNEFYVSRRSFYHYDTQSGGSAIDTLLSLNTALWDRRFATALWGGAGINPIRGIDISANLAHNVVTRNSYVVWDDSTTDTLRNLPHDFSIDLRIGIDNTLYRYITYGGIYFRQLHGRLFPGGGTYFSSWNSEAGFSLITAPLKFDLSLECGGRFFYLDEGPYPDDVIGDSDRVYELFAGIRWDFL